MDSFIRVKCEPKNLEDYSAITPFAVNQILSISKEFKRLKVVHISSTRIGGGVAEILSSIVPLQEYIGLDSRWYIIPPDEAFFEVTKKIHNFLQGKEGDLTNKEKEVYLEYNKKLGSLLSQIETDVLIVHDPQPAPSLSFLKNDKPKFSIWRSHPDTSSPNKKIWDFLYPYLNIYDHMVFSMPDFAPEDLDRKKISFITPAIDPLNSKNIFMTKINADKYIKKFSIDITSPLIVQISRLDPWKDPKGVIRVYRLIKKTIPNIQLALIAQMATDDPESYKVYEEVKKEIRGEKGIFLLVNLPDNELAVNAFQIASDIILQKSIKEGFGLTVTEAMWKGAVVIGGNVGGIKTQIKDGINGFLVNSEEETAEKIIQVLQNSQLAQEISKTAQIRVINKFLITHNLLNWLRLFKRFKTRF